MMLLQFFVIPLGDVGVASITELNKNSFLLGTGKVRGASKVVGQLREYKEIRHTGGARARGRIVCREPSWPGAPSTERGLFGFGVHENKAV